MRKGSEGKAASRLTLSTGSDRPWENPGILAGFWRNCRRACDVREGGKSVERVEIRPAGQLKGPPEKLHVASYNAVKMV